MIDYIAFRTDARDIAMIICIDFNSVINAAILCCFAQDNFLYHEMPGIFNRE